MTSRKPPRKKNVSAMKISTTLAFDGDPVLDDPDRDRDAVAGQFRLVGPVGQDR